MPTKKKTQAITNLTAIEFIRHDPAVCVMPGLFRSFRKGEMRDKLDIVHDFGDGKRLEFSGPDQLGADDLLVLQGLVSLAMKSHKIVPPALDGKMEQEPRVRLALEDDARSMDVLVMEGSFADLAREIGHADLDDVLTLRRCVERMYKVTVIAEVKLPIGRQRKGFHLISGYGSDVAGPAGRLRVALNPQITGVMLGCCPKHTRIDMGEVRSLRTSSVRLIHQRLCGWIDPGKSGFVAIDTLCSYAWPEEDKGALRMRRTRARKALQELVDLGWTVDEYERGKYRIARPVKEGLRLPRDAVPAQAA